jgi:hypothetical protein
MAVKSIIDVDVNDDAFKAFMEMFAKYQTALKKLPGAWDAAGKSMDKSGTVVKGMTDGMERQINFINKQVREQEKMRREVEKTNRSMTDLGRSTMRVAGGIKDITFSLLKWSTLTGVFGLLSGGTGLLGFEALARSASQQRTQSMGLGVTPGQLQAANITYERIGGAGSTLSSIADIQNDVTRQYLLSTRLGISQEDIQTKNPFELLPQTLSALRSRYLAIPENLRGTLAQSYGLTEFGLSMQQLRQLGGMSEEELTGLGTALPGRAEQIGGNNETNRRYQDFLIQLDTAGQRLQTTLIDKLTPLAGPLGDVVDAFTNLAGSALSSNTFRDGLNSFADWINSFAQTLGTEETKTAIADFIEQVGNFATRMMEAGRSVLSFIEAMGRVVEWITRQFSFERPNVPAPSNPMGDYNPMSYTPAAYTPAAYTPASYTPASYTPASHTTGVGGSFIDQMTRAESGGRADARNPLSSAMGAHQFTSGTWLSVTRRFGGSRIAGLTDEQILALRTDPVFSRQMAEAHTQFDLAPALQRAGVAPSNLALYAGWHFGAQGGAAVMQAPGNMPMDQLLSAGAIRSNPYLRSLTAGQWRDRFAGQFSGGGSGGGEGGGRMQTYSAQPGQAVHIMIHDNTGGNIINTSTSLGAPGLAV